MPKHDTVTRYVATHIGRVNGMRTLAQPMQGRFTYATAEQAQAWIDAVMAGNNGDKLEQVFGLPLEVRACECWAGHHDPVGCWFD